MKYLAHYIAVSAIVLLTSCGTPEPLFKFENYQYNNEGKRPLTVDYSYITIANASRSKVLSAIEESLRYEFFEIDGKLPNSLARTFSTGAAQFRANSGYDDNPNIIGCELKVRADAQVFNNTLTYTIEGYKFTGGAHGSSWQTGLNFDLTNGNLLALHDFLNDKQIEALPPILREILCNKRGIFEGDYYEALTRLGYFPNEILPTENFRVYSDAIEFIYNPYEIGIYAVGLTTIKVPFELLDSILEEE